MDKILIRQFTTTILLLLLAVHLQDNHFVLKSTQHLTLSTTIDQAIGLICRVFVNGPGDRNSIPSESYLKLKNGIDAAMLYTQYYQVRIKVGAIQGMELCRPLYLGAAAIENGAFGSPSTKVANFTYFYLLL